jgi:predicted acylesterase/phospholipase RssA
MGSGEHCNIFLNPGLFKMEAGIFKPRVLVLGPGGMKGFLHLGALKYLEKFGHLTEVQKYVGCSVGSIIGLLLLVGYKVQEIMVEAGKVNLFNEADHFSISKSKDYVGIISNSTPKDFLEKAVKLKCGGIPSLSELYERSGKELITVSVNLSKMKSVYFNKNEFPDLPCVDAVLLSINIPLLFYKLMYQGEIFIDGAFCDPYPIHILDDKLTDILGIYITSSFLEDRDINFADYFYRIVQIPIDTIYEMKKKGSSPKCRHLLLKTENLDTTGVTFSTESIVRMIVDGYYSAEDFVNELKTTED